MQFCLSVAAINEHLNNVFRIFANKLFDKNTRRQHWFADPCGDVHLKLSQVTTKPVFGFFLPGVAQIGLYSHRSGA